MCDVNYAVIQNFTTRHCCVVKWIARCLGQILAKAMFPIYVKNVMTLVTGCLWVVPELRLCLVLPKLPDFMLSQSFWYNIWMNSLRSSCINYIWASVWLCGLKSISIGSFNHNTLCQVWWHDCASTRAYINWLLFFLLIYNVQKVFANSQLFLCYCILSRSTLNVINEFLKIAIVIHGLTHLNRFGVLPMLLLWILLVDYW